MENKITIFNSLQFGDIRTAGTPDEPLFCLADVCRVLELQVTPTKNRLVTPGVSSIKVGVQTGTKKDGTPAIQKINMTFISERNLYWVIMRSDKPQAEPFQEWVCGEVLPAIRKTGGYMAAKPDDTPEEIMARALLIAQDTMKRQVERIARLKTETRKQARQIKADAPKVLFANAMKASDRSILVGELAKILKQNGYNTGQKRLFAWLREHGFLMKGGSERNQPTQRSMEQGLFEVTKGVVTRPDDTVITTVTTKVTAKGQEYFINKFINQPKLI